MKSRSKKAIRNIIWSALYEIAAIAGGLIIPRLILSAYGSTYNGVVSSATEFLSAISFLTLGIAGATRLALYKTLAVNDVVGTSRIMKANRNYMRKVGLCIIGYAIALSAIYPYISHNDLTHRESALIILIVSVGTFASYFFGISNTTLLSADQSGYIASIANIIKITINTILTAILIGLGCSIFVVKLGSSIIFLINPIVLQFIVNKKYHLITNCEPDPNALSERHSVAFHSIANIVHDNTDLLILTLFTDAKVISVYTVYYLVTGKLKSVLMIFTNGMESAFGNMWVKREIDTLKRSFEAFEFFLYCFTSVVFSCVWILIIPFVTIYTEGIHDINYILPGLAMLLCVTEAMRCIRTPYLILVQATGNYEATKYGALAEAVINLSSSIVLVNFLGIYGVVFGTLIANVFRTTQFALFISNRVINRSIKTVISKAVWLVLTMAFIIITTNIIISHIPFGFSWYWWVVEAVLVFGISVIITLISALLFYRDNVKYLLNKTTYISKIMKKLKLL